MEGIVLNHSVDVAVIGAAGATGRSLVRALLRRGTRVRALLHRETQKSLFPGLDDFALIELEDRTSLVAGLRGAKVAYYIPPTYDAREEEFGANVIAAARECNVDRLVYHSVLHAPTPSMPHHIRKSKVELALRESTLTWTIVQPAMYAQTPFAFLSSERDALTPGFDVTRHFSPIDLEDLSEAVANIVTRDGHAFATYELAGTERLSFEDMAKSIGQATGRSIAARQLDPELVTAQARSHGFSAAAAEELRLMMTHYDKYGLLGNGNVLQMLLGRKPNHFTAVCARDLGR